MNAQGTFEITMQAEPPYDDADGVTLGRVRFDKQFSGALKATSVVTMLAARTSVPTSAAYVALERIRGVLDGRSGSFVVTHVGHAQGSERSLEIRITPDSGTGELAGIRGTMTITQEAGKHFYALDYTLP